MTVTYEMLASLIMYSNASCANSEMPKMLMKEVSEAEI